jgi:hypothetical protein
MRRIAIGIALAAGVAGCAGDTYTFAGVTPTDAGTRAVRYCGEQGAEARFQGVERVKGDTVEVYRCVPLEDADAAP